MVSYQLTSACLVLKGTRIPKDPPPPPPGSLDSAPVCGQLSERRSLLKARSGYSSCICKYFHDIYIHMGHPPNGMLLCLTNLSVTQSKT